MTPVIISFDAWTNLGELELTVYLDHSRAWHGMIGPTTETIEVAVDDEQETQHQLRLGLNGKTAQDTQLDSNGNIVSDKLLFIKHMSVDGIQLDQMLANLACYEHDFNGTREPIKDKFFGSMGCNGVVSMQFHTPVYRWLLENT